MSKLRFLLILVHPTLKFCWLRLPLFLFRLSLVANLCLTRCLFYDAHLSVFSVLCGLFLRSDSLSTSVWCLLHVHAYRLVDPFLLTLPSSLLRQHARVVSVDPAKFSLALYGKWQSHTAHFSFGVHALTCLSAVLLPQQLFEWFPIKIWT